jgi:tetratricopeptide (TPR) repeat protein
MLRKTMILGSIVCLALLLLTPTAEAQNKKKKGGKKGTPAAAPAAPPSDGGGQGAPPPAGPPPPEVGRAERKLIEYKTGEARAALDAVADQADHNAAVAAALGRVLDQEKKYGDATARLRKATELAPADPAPWVYLGEAYLHSRSGDADGAFRKAAELAQASGHDADYYLGVAQQRLRQYDQAVETLQRARASDPGNALVPYQIGVTRVFQEKWTDGVDQLNKAIEMDSGIAYAYYYRGLAAEKLGRKDLLVNDMERFLALAPNAPEADRAKAILRAAQR